MNKRCGAEYLKFVRREEIIDAMDLELMEMEENQGMKGLMVDGNGPWMESCGGGVLRGRWEGASQMCSGPD